MVVNETPTKIKREKPTQKEVAAACENLAQFLFDLYQQYKAKT